MDGGWIRWPYFLFFLSNFESFPVLLVWLYVQSKTNAARLFGHLCVGGFFGHTRSKQAKAKAKTKPNANAKEKAEANANAMECLLC